MRYLVYGLGLLLALLTASCGSNIVSVGTPVITLTSKPGRFSSYVVTIDEIQLNRNDGNVYTLPATSQRVDLANLSAYSNLMMAPAVPTGTYTSATFVLDYSVETPVVTVDDQGNAYPTSLLDDTTKLAPTTETLVVKFDPNHPFVISDQQSSVLAIDIDLEASNIIGANSSGVFTVTVKPFWNVSAQPTFDKQIFARGLYVLADTKNNNFVMNVRPLHDVINSPFGALKVNVDNNTYWSVNGNTYIGASGLAALNSLQNVYADLQVGVYGPTTGNPFTNLNTAGSITPTFTATQVYVGSSLESTLEDQVTGFVSAISSDGKTITVQRASTVDHAGNFGFAQAVPVTVGTGTKVTVDGVTSPAPSLSSISVGQVITALGVATEPDYPIDFNYTGLDSSGAVVSGPVIRVQSTPMIGQLKSATANSMTLNLLQIDHAEPNYVNFTGTGAGTNADPTNYLVTTQTDESALPAGTLLRIDGMTTAFGSGPPYFNAATVTPLVEQQLIIEWTSTASNTGAGSVKPFTVVNSAGIIVNLTDASLVASSDATHGTAIIRTGPLIDYDLIGTYGSGVPATPPPNPSLLTITFNTTDTQHPPLYGVGSDAVGGYVHTDPGNFAADTQIVTDGATPIKKLVAYGQYDPTTGAFAATRMTINAQ